MNAIDKINFVYVMKLSPSYLAQGSEPRRRAGCSFYKGFLIVELR